MIFVYHKGCILIFVPSLKIPGELCFTGIITFSVPLLKCFSNIGIIVYVFYLRNLCNFYKIFTHVTKIQSFNIITVRPGGLALFFNLDIRYSVLTLYKYVALPLQSFAFMYVVILIQGAHQLS